ncbi:hypothetical protein QQS21_009269 [Conoideocrella luteorostrata]|uniref:Gfd2/YDR514C-like C-terminal domain-containing protein n=1 Tax=Conoideocrella luteorostrata TaxID=1105319 RepID=A0AAJ0CH77_9HYPO|nr:hypothetical protein QQS21_009269 [Conoideocrella luteorostrata]
MDSSCQARLPLKSTLKPSLGGLEHPERLLGLRQDRLLSTDAIFISLDLEVASDRKRLLRSGKRPDITQIGFARLDTRDLCSLPISSSSDLRRFIAVRYFQVTALSLSKSAQAKRRKVCVFAEPTKIKQHQIPSVITRSLQIRDRSREDGSLRSVVLVGPSVKGDLKIIQHLDIQLFETAPIYTAIDTYLLARYILPPYSLDISLQPGQKFTLAGILSALGCRPNTSNFHNAGNDAAYTIYVMLLLAVQHATGRAAELKFE